MSSRRKRMFSFAPLRVLRGAIACRRLWDWLAASVFLASAVAFAQEERVIELPPFIVNEAPRPWRFVAADGLEVLSRCDDTRTIAMVRRLQRLDELLRVVLPDELRFRTTASHTVILVEAVAAPAASRQLIEQYVSAAPRADVRMLPNLGLGDVDALATFAILDPHTFKAQDVGPAIDHLRMILGRRVPQLPAWYIEGCLRVLSHANFADREVVIAPFKWETDATRFADDPDTARELLPAPEFFARAQRAADPAGNPKRDEDRYLLALARLRGAEPAADERWKVQAELFVRWSLASAERSAALVRFVNASSGPESEAVFRSCFGFGYADCRDRLSDYLPDATARRLVLPVVKTATATPKPRNATPAEIARLKIEWERLAWLYVRTHHPEFAPAYLQVVRQTAATAHRDAGSDAAVCGAEGLLEIDDGNPTAARPLLELALGTRAVRPRVCVELARLRLAEAVIVSKSVGAISAAEAEAVLGLLRRASVQQPPLAMTDSVAAEVWARAGLPLDASRRAELEAALVRFPAYPPLLYYGSVLFAHAGLTEQTLALVARARLAPTEPALKARLDALERTIRGSPDPAAAP